MASSMKHHWLKLQVVGMLIVSFSCSCTGVVYNVGGFDHDVFNWFDPLSSEVGGALNYDTSYQDWADSITFYDTDTLWFTYNASLNNVVLVPSKAEFDTCSYNSSTILYNDQSGTTALTTYQAPRYEERIWYVYSSWLTSECLHGMKFSIVVRGTLGGPGSLSPGESSQPSPSTAVPQIIINWTAYTNFSDSTANLTHLTLDSYIEFVFNNKTYQVVQVPDEQHYEKCNASSPSGINPNILSGQRINLPRAGKYYFIDNNHRTCKGSNLKLVWTVTDNSTSGSEKDCQAKEATSKVLYFAAPGAPLSPTADVVRLLLDSSPSGPPKFFIVGISVIGGIIFLCIVMNILRLMCEDEDKDKDKDSVTVRSGGPGHGDSSAVDWARRQKVLEGILERHKVSNTRRIYTYEELKKATNNFSSTNKLGSGAFGTVYQGTMSTGTIVAIKRTNNGGTDVEQFLNEVSILSQVNNRHLVKLLGCCVDLDVPLLVYEFISNGTVQDHLIDAREGRPTKLDWDMRFKIAIQTAKALAYLHVQAEPPIFHRDVKSANILLDESFNAKVADFGLSKLVDMDATHLSTVVKGTIGYLDPEYYDTGQLTDKADVYSFGMVLLELITSKKPVDLSLEPGHQNLKISSMPFITSGRTREIIDETLISNSLTGDDYVVIEGVAQIAAACLGLHRALRPSMSEVVEMLRNLKSSIPTAAGFLAKASSPESPVKGINIQERFHFLFSQSSTVSTPEAAGLSDRTPPDGHHKIEIQSENVVPVLSDRQGEKIQRGQGRN